MDDDDAPLTVELGTSFFVLAAVAAVFTLGVALLAMWWISMSYPARLDPEGVVTRGGARHAWTDLKQTLKLQKGGLRLDFPGGSVLVVPRFLAAPGPVLAYFQRHGVETGVYLTRVS